MTALRTDIKPSAPAPASQTPTVVLVEDHVALRKGVELLLRSEGLSVIGVADDVDYAYELVSRRRPDVVVVDIGLRGRSGLELARRLLEEDPDAGVLLYSGSMDRDVLSEAMGTGVRGLALKNGTPRELVGAIRSIAAGGSYFDPELSALVSPAPGKSGHLLSGREREILGMLANGMNGTAIARDLMISSETVRTHVRNAMRKLAARTRVHAVTLALKRHEISLH
ncbi:MAG TPA: response regulator transcription factor [Solirubrobacteraceae bacterium]|nr:response regulator transcription factor [Solirubrobacteraceae bacterium]